MNLVALYFMDEHDDEIVDARSLRMGVLHFRTFLTTTYRGQFIHGVEDVLSELDRQLSLSSGINLVIKDKNVSSMIWSQCVSDHYIPHRFDLCKIGIVTLKVLSC